MGKLAENRADRERDETLSHLASAASHPHAVGPERSSGKFQASMRLASLACEDDHTDYAGILRRVGHRLVMLAESYELDHSLCEDATNPGEKLSWEIGPRDRVLAELAQALYLSRRRREKYLEKGLFGEPSWDILLDLYVHHVRNRALRTTSVCVASDVPLTTGLRWITVLESQGLVERGGIERDKRTNLVWLTKAGAQAVRNCLTEFWSQLQSILD